MSLLWHLIRKDFRRLRLPLVVWSSIQFITCAAPAALWLWPAAFGARLPTLLSFLGFLIGASLLASYDFATRLIHEDAPADPQSFWRTRPISGWRLLSAKLLGLFLFTILAAIPAILLQLSLTDSDARSLLSLSLGWLALVAFPLFPALLFASLTRTSRECLLASFLALLAVGTWTMIATYRAGSTSIDTGLTTNRILVGLILVTVISTLTFVHQFVTQRQVRSQIILGFGFILVVTLPWWWHYRFDLSTPAAETELTRAIDVRFSPLVLTPERETRSSRDGRRSWYTTLTWSGVPAGYYPQSLSALHTWHTPTPATHQNKLNRSGSPDLTSLLRGETDFRKPTTLGNFFPRELSEQLVRQSPTPAYTGKLTFQLYHPEVVFETPLRVGTRLTTASGHQLHVTEIDLKKQTISVLLRSPISDSPAGFSVSIDLNASGITDTYALQNKRTGEILPFYVSNATSLPVLRFTYFTLKPQSRSDQPSPLTEDFLRDAVLVKLTARPVGQFTRTLTQPAGEITLRPAP